MRTVLAYLLCISLARRSESTPPIHANVKGQPLSRAYASPLNVDRKLDCAVKELAWEYAKKLLPRVSSNDVI